MSDLTPISCITKIKQCWFDFYNASCFWPKFISILIILALAIFGLFKIITSAFYYFSEPLSYFDPERLGQLGDFLGGTLNPIFGFATVCLLLWSIFIQRKELSLTRDELSKSASALEKQVNLATDEYNRKQIESLLQQAKTDYTTNKNEKFQPIEIKLMQPDGMTTITISAASLSDIYRHTIDHKKTITTNIFELTNISTTTKMLFEKEKHTAERIITLYFDLIILTNISSLSDLLKKDIELYIEEFLKIGLINSKSYQTYKSLIEEPKLYRNHEVIAYR